MRRSFVDTLRDLRSGEVLDQLDEHMQELVRAVQTTQAGGQITLTIIVAPTKGSSEAVVVKDAIKLKKPEIKSAGTLMFPTVEGNLQRSNPNQRDLPGITLASDNDTPARRTAGE
ncbi:MAG: hypothetical protein WBC18_07985 [Ottowia sp.]|uniref:hypothetical protein n=1 Tax=Ottowia sp. TaxID=1898956 RepID=UPI003C71245E